MMATNAIPARAAMPDETAVFEAAATAPRVVPVKTIPDAVPQGYERQPLAWDELVAMEPPPRDWAIQGWLGMGHTTLLAGLGGIGKTLLGQMIGSALAIGRTFVDEVSTPRRVLFWAAEDDHDELWRRQVAIAAHFGVPLTVFVKNLIVESFADRDCTLMDLDLGGRLIRTGMHDELREQVADYKADVVILDNASRTFAGKESDRNHVTRFVASLNAAAGAAAVLLLAHPGRAPGSEYSGSSAWENAARARMFLSDRPPDAHLFEKDENEPDTSRRYLAKRKTNYSARELRTFNYENGVLIPEQSAETGGIVGALTDRRDERILVAAFRKLSGEMGQQPTDGETSPSYLPKLVLQFNLGEGRTKRELGKAMRRLMVTGDLQRRAVGQYANRSQRFGLVLSESAAL